MFSTTRIAKRCFFSSPSTASNRFVLQFWPDLDQETERNVFFLLVAQGDRLKNTTKTKFLLLSFRQSIRWWCCCWWTTRQTQLRQKWVWKRSSTKLDVVKVSLIDEIRWVERRWTFLDLNFIRWTFPFEFFVRNRLNKHQVGQRSPHHIDRKWFWRINRYFDEIETFIRKFHREKSFLFLDFSFVLVERRQIENWLVAPFYSNVFR